MIACSALSAAASAKDTVPAAQGITIANSRWPSTASLKRFGEDCIRLAGAATDEAKAIAVWRCTIMLTQATEVIPAEPALGLSQISNPMKLLNVYGGHWCDGLSRIMEMTWRALGYRADKLYKFGHTFADIHYRDDDAVDRWHVFDLSQKWFVYDRTGRHISTADEQAMDHSLIYYPSRTPVPNQPSFMQPSYVHTGHLQFEPYSAGINLRTGERIEFLWGHEGAPYLNIFGSKPAKNVLHGPYPATYGSGRLVTRPLLIADAFNEYGLDSADNVLVTKDTDGINYLHPGKAGTAAFWIFKIALPYIISEAAFDATVLKTGKEDEIAISVSTDSGSTWKRCWEAKESPYRQEIKLAPLSERFDPAAKQVPATISPFGRYEYFIKIEMQAETDPEKCRLENFALTTRFQHNIFALPMLWPGKNDISIEGKLRAGRELSVVYDWDDSSGSGRRKQFNFIQVPANQRIETKGRNWEDVICRSLIIEAILRKSAQAATPAAAAQAGVQALSLHTVVPTNRIIGSIPAPRPASSGRLIRRIKETLQRQSDPATPDIDLRKMAGQIGDDILALGALRDPSSREVLERVILESRTHASQHRVWAIQALYNTVGKDAAPALMKVLGKDSSIVFYDPKKESSKDAMWLYAAATAAAALAAIGDFDKRAEAADLITAALQNRMTSLPLRQIWRGEEIEWGLIRALGFLGDRRHAAALYRYLTPGNDSDEMAEAIRALSNIRASDSLPQIVQSLQMFKYMPVGLNAVSAIGRLGGPGEASVIAPLLGHVDEEMRAAAVQTLAMIGGVDALPQIRRAESAEAVPWVRAVMNASAGEAERRKGVPEKAP